MKRAPRRLPRRALASLLCVGLAGCVATTFGARVDRSRLAALRGGESTTADLLLALGEPDGRGAARLEPAAPRLDVWLYDYGRELAPGAAPVEFELLLVFVRDGRYDGHLWLPGRLDASLR